MLPQLKQTASDSLRNQTTFATMFPTSFIRWLFHILSHFFQQTPKRLHDVKPPSIFACASCRAPLHTIYRFGDESYCKSCRADIDSDESDDDAFTD